MNTCMKPMGRYFLADGMHWIVVPFCLGTSREWTWTKKELWEASKKLIAFMQGTFETLFYF